MKPNLNIISNNARRSQRHCEHCYTRIKQLEIYTDYYYCDNCDEIYDLEEIKLLITKEELGIIVDSFEVLEEVYGINNSKIPALLDYLNAKKDYYDNPANDPFNPLAVPRCTRIRK